MNKKSVYCTAPWNGLTVHEDGRVLTCCVGLNELAEQLKTPTVTPISLKEFNNKIQWYNKWSDQKFADLWPEVNQLIHRTLK